MLSDRGQTDKRNSKPCWTKVPAHKWTLKDLHQPQVWVNGLFLGEGACVWKTQSLGDFLQEVEIQRRQEKVRVTEWTGGPRAGERERGQAERWVLVPPLD